MGARDDRRHVAAARVIEAAREDRAARKGNGAEALRRMGTEGIRDWLAETDRRVGQVRMLGQEALELRVGTRVLAPQALGILPVRQEQHKCFLLQLRVGQVLRVCLRLPLMATTPAREARRESARRRRGRVAAPLTGPRKRYSRSGRFLTLLAGFLAAAFR